VTSETSCLFTRAQRGPVQGGFRPQGEPVQGCIRSPRAPRSGVALRSEATAFRARPGLLPPDAEKRGVFPPLTTQRDRNQKRVSAGANVPSRSSVAKALWPKRDQILKVSEQRLIVEKISRPSAVPFSCFADGQSFALRFVYMVLMEWGGLL